MTTEESFFSLLKAHRKSENIDIQDIAEYTKINPKYLYAIESGDFNILPKVYMRLFLRSYAKFIGVNHEQALNDYEVYTTGKTNTKKESLTTAKSPEIPLSPFSNGSKILESSPIPPKQIAVGAVIVIGIIIFFNFVSSLSKENQNSTPIPKIPKKTEKTNALGTEESVNLKNTKFDKLSAQDEKSLLPNTIAKKKL